MNYKEQIKFNKDCINLYYHQLNNSDKSQKKSIWSKIINLLKQNMDFIGEIKKYKKENQSRRVIKTPPLAPPLWRRGEKITPLLAPTLKGEGEEDLDFYNNDKVRNDFNYDFELQYKGAEGRI